jgi:hypothetical protein
MARGKAKERRLLFVVQGIDDNGKDREFEIIKEDKTIFIRQWNDRGVYYDYRYPLPHAYPEAIQQEISTVFKVNKTSVKFSSELPRLRSMF